MQHTQYFSVQSKLGALHQIDIERTIVSCLHKMNRYKQHYLQNDINIRIHWYTHTRVHLVKSNGDVCKTKNKNIAVAN